MESISHILDDLFLAFPSLRGLKERGEEEEERVFEDREEEEEKEREEEEEGRDEDREDG